jgi:hypothetical protein
MRSKPIAELLGENQLNKQTALTEAGAIVSGRGLFYCFAAK